MYMLMFYKMALITECPVTNFTNIRTLTTMYALMSCKSVLLSEGLITLFTCI